MRPPPGHKVHPGIRLRFAWAGGISLLAWTILRAVSPGAAIPWTPAMIQASRAMEEVVEGVAQHCRMYGIPVDPAVDPNGTCLVGPEFTGLFTSLGQLEAKRTSTTPDMAGLLVHLLSEAGVEEGDRVAVGASGSFPALLVATLVAVDALGAKAVSLLSLGSSGYGATRPDFHLLDLYSLLMSGGYVEDPPSGVSLGGSGDVGREFDPEIRDRLVESVSRLDLFLIREPDLPSNVSARMDLYGVGTLPEGGESSDIAAFVNVGGAGANLGTSPMVLSLPPGLVETVDLPTEEDQGVLFRMAARGIPVIHLLHVRGLILRYGLPWDPLPLPEAGSTVLRDSHRGKDGAFWLVTMAYLCGLALVVFKGGRSARSSSRTVR